MFSLRRIRSQMYFGVIMLLVVVTVLSAASLQGVLKFRKLTKSMRERSLELPKAADLAQEVSELRSLLWQTRSFNDNYHFPQVDRLDLQTKIQSVELALDNYRIQLDNCQIIDPRIAEKTGCINRWNNCNRRFGFRRRSGW